MTRRNPRLRWSEGAAGPFLTGLDTGEPAAWQDFAACAETDPELFFPEKGGTCRLAKMICARCPVAAECLEYGFWDQFGIYGGLNPAERRRLRRGEAA